MPRKDIEARRQQHREYMRTVWYPKNKGKHLAMVSVTRASRKKRTAVFFAEHKILLSCSVCGEDHPAVLDFHHRDPSEKEYAISSMVAAGMSVDAIKAEMAKCDVLCSNCHRKLHWEEKKNRVPQRKRSSRSFPLFVGEG